MKKILYFLKDYKKESILAPLFKMLEAIFELIVPLVMAAIIDVGIAHGDKHYVIRMCLVLTGLGILRQKQRSAWRRSCVIQYFLIFRIFPFQGLTRSERQRLLHE